jgi:hypothetical protein
MMVREAIEPLRALDVVDFTSELTELLCLPPQQGHFCLSASGGHAAMLSGSW